MMHKTTIFLLLVTIFLTTLNAQILPKHAFRLNCEISGPASDSIILRYSNEEGKIETLTTSYNGGIVKFTGLIAFPRVAALSVKSTSKGKEKRIAEFFISPGQMFFKADVTQITKPTLVGSKTNDEWLEVIKLQEPARNSLDSLYKAKTSHVANDKLLIDNEILLSENRFARITQNYIQAHPASFTSINLIYELLDIVPKTTVLMLFNSLNVNIKNNWMGETLLKRINQNEELPTLLGLKAPNFKSQTIQKIPINLEDFRGKIVLLDFWASWCKPCRTNTPKILKLYNEYKDTGFAIIGIADDDGNKNAWENVIKLEGTSEWHHILRGYVKYTKENPDDIHKLFNVPYLPTYILIDKQGTVVGIYGAEQEDLEALKTKIKSLI